MLTSDTTNVESCIEEIARLDAVDCEIIRLTVPNQKSIDSLPAIRTEMKKRGIERPLVADIHFNPQLAVMYVNLWKKSALIQAIMSTGKNLKYANILICSIRKNWNVLKKNCFR